MILPVLAAPVQAPMAAWGAHKPHPVPLEQQLRGSQLLRVVQSPGEEVVEAPEPRQEVQQGQDGGGCEQGLLAEGEAEHLQVVAQVGTTLEHVCNIL